MASLDPVNGVDYLIDYYSLLGVERDATAETITTAYRQMQMQYHPDRFQGLAPELFHRAEHQSNLVNEAYTILDDDSNKRAYDQKLAGWKKPLSKHGEIIVDLDASGFSFTTLLGNLNADPEQREKEAETIASQFSGFNKATYDFICGQAASPGGIPPELKAAYVEQLEQRDLHLSLREGLLWESIGQRNHAPAPRLEYREHMREVLESTKQEAIRGVEEQVLLIAAGERALLPAPEGSGDNADASQVLAHYTARLDEHFQKQAAILEPLAAEREQILEERFATSAKIVYHPETVSYTPKLILEIKHGNAPVWLMFEFSGDSVKGTHLDGLEELAKPEIAREWIGRGYTILSFQAIKGIDFRSQLDRVLTLHAEKLAALTMQHTIEIAS